MNPVLTVSSKPEPEVGDVVEEGMNAFNDAIVGYADRTPLHVIVRDLDSNTIVGGISGKTSLGLMFIDLVYLPEILRGQDIGSRMMELAENEARRRGCRAGVLFTINFQAPNFYQRLGWRVFGEVACDPPGTSRIFLTKDFR
jgi:GNAT superfamily N-acetyltransferase